MTLIILIRFLSSVLKSNVVILVVKRILIVAIVQILVMNSQTLTKLLVNQIRVRNCVTQRIAVYRIVRFRSILVYVQRNSSHYQKVQNALLLNLTVILGTNSVRFVIVVSRVV